MANKIKVYNKCKKKYTNNNNNNNVHNNVLVG